jgi:hypothetical protein
VPLGRNHARPSRTARVWPAARVRGPARPAHTTRGARRERAALPGGTRLGGGAARRADGGTTPVRGKRPRSSGSPARCQRARLRLGRRCGRRGGREAGAVGKATVGVTAAGVRRALSATAAARRAGRLSIGRDAVEAAVGTHGMLSQQRL